MNTSDQPNTRPPEHVFVSYSRADSEIADKLVLDLERYGIAVWIDHELKPGTPNWNMAIRDAIERAYAVIVVATPSSGSSDAVHGEIALARARGTAACPIIPAWCLGGVWPECVPLELITAQYIDCRGTEYDDTGLVRLVDALQNQFAMVAPNRFVLKQEMATRPDHLPRGYLAITLAHEPTTIAVRLHAYPSLRALLDDIFLTYLSEVYQPYTYGTTWVLEHSSDYWAVPGRLLVPWLWLTERYRGSRITGSDLAWANDVPSKYDLWEGSSWTVSLVQERAPWGIVTNTVPQYRELVGDPKMKIMFVDSLNQMSLHGIDSYERDGISIKRVSPGTIRGEDYAFQSIFMPRNQPSKSEAFVCTLSDEILILRYPGLFRVLEEFRGAVDRGR